MALLKVDVAGVGIDPKSRAFFVALKDRQDTVLPILIGSFEAQGISAKLMGDDPTTPGVYNTIKTLLDATGVQVARVVVNELTQDTFFAQITLDAEGKEFSLDCRPSDAIAIALRCEAPIYVADHVMRKAGGPFEALSKPRPKDTEGTARPRAGQDQLKRLKLRLKRLVEREDYKQAAAVRDQIMKLERGGS